MPTCVMKKSLLIFFSILSVASCLDRLNIPIPSEYSQDLVVDGQITDEQGPYIVKLTRLIKIDGQQIVGSPTSAKKVTIFDDFGNLEVLEQKDAGIYQTKLGGIRGVIGREYHVRIEMNDGKIFESLPDRMNPVGELDSLYYEFVSTQPVDAPTEYGYKIYVDAQGVPNTDYYLRWKFTGTYVIETKPQYYKVSGCPPCGCPAPLPCSGYAFVDGVLTLGWTFDLAKQIAIFVPGLKCECCRCWVTQHEEALKVKGHQINSSGKFPKLKVAYIPINFYTFFERYRVEIKQMSLSKAAYDYWISIQYQKEAVGSLFQPITGKIQTNIFEINKSSGVQGIFYASAVKKKQLYLDKRTHKVDIQVPVNCDGRIGAAGVSCLTFPGSTTLQPEDWN